MGEGSRATGVIVTPLLPWFPNILLIVEKEASQERYTVFNVTADD